MNSFLLRFLCALLVSVSVSPTFAGGKKPKPIEYHDTVIAGITADSITVDQDKVMKSYKITQFTEVTLRGKKAAVTELQPGMTVSVTMGSDATIASRIAAGDPPVHNDRPNSKKGR